MFRPQVCCAHPLFASHPEDPDGLSCGLHLTGSEIVESQRELTANLVMDASRDKDSARVGHRLQPDRDDDPVAIKIAGIYDPVAHHLDDAAVMLSDKRYQNSPATLLQYRERSRLVPLNQSAITDHIGSEDSTQAPLHAFFGHAIGSPLENAVPSIVLGRRGDV